MTEVVFSDTRKGIKAAVRESFEKGMGTPSMIKPDIEVFLKVNAVGGIKHCYTEPEVLRETILYLQQNGAGRIYVIENCTQANFTRLVFRTTGIEKVCKETGVTSVYLDETGSTPIFLKGLESFIDISDFVHEKLIVNRKKSLYISLPKLKTHSMSQVTLAIKNQFGLVHQFSRIADHNYRLHQKFADIYEVLRPDFVIIDGLVATNHGHFNAVANFPECIEKTECLIAGRDPLAVDVAASAFMGFGIDEVKHLKLSADKGLGEGDINKIKIINNKLFDERKKNLTCKPLERFPQNLDIHRGRERCCEEGCRRNTEAGVEILYCDYGGKGAFSILMGKDIDPEKVEAIKDPVHIAGSCAIQDYGLYLQNKLGKKMVTMSHGCNNLAETMDGLCHQMKVNPLKLADINPISALSLLIRARLNKTRANITPIF
jgi:uncharacterized protein (DUF362 family)